MNPTLRLSLLVVLLCGLVYSNALFNGFVYDDWDLIVNNRWLKDGPFLDAFRIGYWESSRGGSFYYRPAVSVSYWVDHMIWEERPAGYRLRNIVLHAAASILVLLLAARWLSSLPAAAAAAALFAVHPVHTQSVTWIAGRTDLLATVFFLLALLLMQLGRERAGPTSRAAIALTFGGFVALGLALLSKEMAVTFPALLALHVLFTSRRRSGGGWRPWMVPLGGAAVMVAAWLLVRVMIVGSAAGFADDPHAWWQPGDGTTSRILAVPLILAFYLRRILFPWWLAFESGIEPVRHAADPQIWIAAGGAVLLLVLAYRIRRREPAVAFGVGWFLLTLLPVLNIFPIFESAMEHFAYLPSVGLIVAAVAVGRTIISSPRPAPGTVRVAVCVVLVALLGARAMARNADWRDEETFWRATVRDSPSARAWNNLGLLLRESGRTDEAALALNEVRRRRPDLPSSHTNLGVIAAARGGRDAAISLFRQALSIDPHNADALYNLALLLEENERGQRYGPGFPAGEALSTYTRLVETHPAHAEGWTNLGVLHERLRNPEEARAAYGAAIRAAPHLPEPHVFLAAHLWEMGERQRAAALYRRYLELAPTGPFASEAHSRSQP